MGKGLERTGMGAQLRFLQASDFFVILLPSFYRFSRVHEECVESFSAHASRIQEGPQPVKLKWQEEMGSGMDTIS